MKKAQQMEIVLNPEISKWRIGGSIVDEDLAKDIKTTGQLQNIITRRLPNGKLELIGGQRRYLALKSIGKTPLEKWTSKSAKTYPMQTQ